MSLEKRTRRKLVWLHREHACHWCGRSLTWDDSGLQMTVDHVIARSKGGSNRLGNLVPSCFACNHAKADLDPVDFAMLRRKQLSAF